MKHDERLVEEFAAIWYARDFVVSLEQARESIAKYRTEEHSGDCIKQPWTCLRCTADDALEAGREMLAAINDLGMWVAPWKATRSIEQQLRSKHFGYQWDAARDAYLAEQGERE